MRLALVSQRRLLRVLDTFKLPCARSALRDAAGMTCTTTTSSSIPTRATLFRNKHTSPSDHFILENRLPLVRPHVQLGKLPETTVLLTQRGCVLFPRIHSNAPLTRTFELASGPQAQAGSRCYAARAMVKDCSPSDAASGGVAPSTPSAPAGVTFVSSGESDTGLLAQLLVQVSEPGDVICLYGQVGAGKSVFRCTPSSQWFAHIPA